MTPIDSYAWAPSSLRRSANGVRQPWHFGSLLRAPLRLAAGPVQEGLEESVPGGAGGEHLMPRPDVAKGWLGTVGQEHPIGPTRIGGLPEIERARSPPPRTWPVERMRPLVPRK